MCAYFKNMRLKCMPVPETRKSQQSLPQRICTPKGPVRRNILSNGYIPLVPGWQQRCVWGQTQLACSGISGWIHPIPGWEHPPVHPDWLSGPEPLSAEWHGLRHPAHVQCSCGQANKVAMATAQLLYFAGNPASDGFGELEHCHVGTESSCESVS